MATFRSNLVRAGDLAVAVSLDILLHALTFSGVFLRCILAILGLRLLGVHLPLGSWTTYAGMFTLVVVFDMTIFRGLSQAVLHSRVKESSMVQSYRAKTFGS